MRLISTLAFAFLVFISFSGCLDLGVQSYKKDCDLKATANEKNACYIDFASRELNIGYCSKVDENSLKDWCFTETTKALAQNCALNPSSGSKSPMECMACCTNAFEKYANYASLCNSNCIKIDSNLKKANLKN